MSYIKNIKGKFTIIPRDNLGKAESKSVNSQNSLIFKELMKGHKLNLLAVIRGPIFCSKLATRISDIRAALEPFDIEIKHDNNQGQRGADYFIYYLAASDIAKLEALCL